jgi:Domain of unknown function (DUF4249)
MKKLKYILLILPILTVFSCTTLLEDIKLPYEERLVIQSFISPQDTLLEVKLSKTSPATGTFTQGNYNGTGWGKPVNGAVIEISDGQKKGVFQFQTITNPGGTVGDPATGNQVPQVRSGYFLKTKDFPIVLGHTYILTAKVPNLPDVSATCTIPNKQLIDGKDILVVKGSGIDSVQNGYSSTNGVITNRYYNLSRRFDVTVKDSPFEENFYAVAYYTREVFQLKDPKGNIITQINNNQQYFSDFISDLKQDGKVLNFKKANIPMSSYSTYPNSTNPTPVSNVLSIYVAITDKPYYQYNKSLINSGGINNDDPFSEAVLTYTNINGGLGVFAGYNTTRVEVDLLKK